MSKTKVSAIHVSRRGAWIILIQDEGGVLRKIKMLKNTSVFDFRGNALEEQVKKLAREIGVDKKDIDAALIDEAANSKRKPPKYLRKV